MVAKQVEEIKELLPLHFEGDSLLHYLHYRTTVVDLRHLDSNQEHWGRHNQ